MNKDKKHELMKKTAMSMIRCMALLTDSPEASRKAHRELIDGMLDLAMYNDKWDETDDKVLVNAIVEYLRLCQNLLKE